MIPKKFSLNVYEKNFTDCFFDISYYKNGKIKISVYGISEDDIDIGHFLDITLEQYVKKLQPNEIIVDIKFKCEILEQLKELGILKRQTGIFARGLTIYPIYEIDRVTLDEYCYQNEYIPA